MMNLENIKNLEVDLATRDKKLANLEAQMYAKRFLLIQKRRALANSVKQNSFLSEVKKDYDAYYTHIVSQKEEQIQAMKYLANYITDISNEGLLNDDSIRDTKNHQEWVVSEMQKIKRELDEIVKS
jgi:hypothetical protein